MCVSEAFRELEKDFGHECVTGHQKDTGSHTCYLKLLNASWRDHKAHINPDWTCMCVHLCYTGECAKVFFFCLSTGEGCACVMILKCADLRCVWRSAEVLIDSLYLLTLESPEDLHSQSPDTFSRVNSFVVLSRSSWFNRWFGLSRESLAIFTNKNVSWCSLSFLYFFFHIATFLTKPCISIFRGFKVLQYQTWRTCSLLYITRGITLFYLCEWRVKPHILVSSLRGNLHRRRD